MNPPRKQVEGTDTSGGSRCGYIHWMDSIIHSRESTKCPPQLTASSKPNLLSFFRRNILWKPHHNSATTSESCVFVRKPIPSPKWIHNQKFKRGKPTTTIFISSRLLSGCKMGKAKQLSCLVWFRNISTVPFVWNLHFLLWTRSPFHQYIFFTPRPILKHTTRGDTPVARILCPCLVLSPYTDRKLPNHTLRNHFGVTPAIFTKVLNFFLRVLIF